MNNRERESGKAHRKAHQNPIKPTAYEECIKLEFKDKNYCKGRRKL